MTVRSIAISNIKGGVGKTTTTVNLGFALSKKGLKILLIDCDPQGNLLSHFGRNITPPKGKTLYEVLLKQVPVKDAILATAYPNLHVLPSTVDLAAISLDLSIPNKFTNPLLILKEAIQPLLNYYDYILFDCMPSPGHLSFLPLAAAGEVLIPVQAEAQSVVGLTQMLDMVNMIRTTQNPDLHITGILMTMVDSRTNHCTDVTQLIRKRFINTDIRVFDTVISRSIRFADAPLDGQPALAVNYFQPAVQTYNSLAEEVLEHDRKKDTRSILTR